ncbi:MAG: DUF1214 domain-containing protein [marine benthic group bacterium]|nr:DUF1214 domain-containing protein [Gemmatimonadota bacterium]
MRSHSTHGLPAALPIALAVVLTAACGGGDAPGPVSDLTDGEVDRLVRLAFPYVALYNVNNKSIATAGGLNTIIADTRLKDHTLQDIARPNNDTYYIGAVLDLRETAVVLDLPAFDSDYASLMVTAYDHYVNVPLSTRQGDFRDPTRILFYTERTPGYDGEAVEGVDEYFEATGDIVSAVLRVMPHAAEPERMARITEQANQVRLETLAELRGEPAPTADGSEMPPVGATDVDLFRDNLLEVMQFVFNHVTLDPSNPDDQAVLEAFAPLGIAPGDTYNEAELQTALGPRLATAAQAVEQEWMAAMADPEVFERIRPVAFQPKGETTAEAVLAYSVFGPIGLPQQEAVYPSIGTADGQPLNALNDYVIRMDADELPPARAFWSLTLYDLENGFFIPNDRLKYSVGANSGMQLDDDGGIEIWIAHEQPPAVPEENWLPIPREDLDLSLTMRVYVPDLDAFDEWTAPVADQVDGG